MKNRKTIFTLAAALVLIGVLAVFNWQSIVDLIKDKPAPPPVPSTQTPEEPAPAVNGTAVLPAAPDGEAPADAPTGPDGERLPLESMDDVNATALGDGADDFALEAPEDGTEREYATEKEPARTTSANATQWNATDAVDGDENRVVTWNFVDDLAGFLVANYYPPGTHPQAGSSGMSTISMAKLNMRYGTEMTGLHPPEDAGGLLQAREEVLQYVLSPMMMRIIYALYADRFVDALERKARTMEKTFIAADPPVVRPMNAEEVNAFLRTSAAWARGVADTLAKTAELEDLRLRVENYRQAVRQALEANDAFLNALALEEERLEQIEQADVPSDELKDLFNQARARKDAAGAAYGEAIRRREQIKKDLAARLTPDPADKRLSPNERIYIGMWVARRLVDDPSTPEGLKVAASLLHDLADQIQARGEPRG